MDLTWKRRALAVASVALVVAAGAAVPAQAGKDRVMRGEFSRLATAGTHVPALRGHAQLVRTGSGKTMLTVRLRGLAPGETYGVHLHEAPCSATNPGGGHYQNVESTTFVTPPNELWASSNRRDPMAGVTANRAGKAHGKGVARWTARSDAQAVVIHIGKSHGGTTAGGIKLACADLS